MDGWMDGWTDGRTDGRADINRYIIYIIYIIQIHYTGMPHYIHYTDIPYPAGGGLVPCDSDWADSDRAGSGGRVELEGLNKGRQGRREERSGRTDGRTER